MKPEAQEYAGHRIELRPRDDQTELLIDGIPVRYGQLPDGLYFLHDYAYDWSDNLMELAQKFIAYQQRADEIRREREAGE
jgi:hypothetical protein